MKKYLAITAAVACVVSVAAVSVGVLSAAVCPQAVRASATAAVMARYFFMMFPPRIVCSVL